jgi:hypothetical protein
MPSYEFPWDTGPPAGARPAPPKEQAAEPKPRGRRPNGPGAGPRTASGPDWLYHRLVVSGPGETAEEFAAAARGAGVVPWRLDFAAIEEDVFVRAVSVPAHGRSLSIEGCRILARQFREKVEMRQARAIALVGQSRACPFDLHALLPVPPPVLDLGPLHPDSLRWLATNWGVTDGLRQVAALDAPAPGRRLPKGHAATGWGFFTFGETPSAAIERIGAAWPALRFALQPRPSA